MSALRPGLPHRSGPVRVIFCALAAVLLQGLWGCQKAPADATALPTTPPSAGAPLRELVVLATSDLRDTEGLSALVAEATGVRLTWEFGGTNDSTEAVLNGTTRADAAWFANARLLFSHPEAAPRVVEHSKIMTSPLAVGVSQSVAQSLGWADPVTAATVSWKTITQAAAAGQITYALHNPATANQGYLALMGVVAAASGKGEALRAADIDRRAIANFLTGYRLSSETIDLTQQFIEQQGRQVNTFITYESSLLGLNRGGQLREPLVLIYPHEGVATADYPFMLLNEARQDDYRQVSAYLRSAPAQTWLAQNTLRRPVHPEVATHLQDLLPPLDPHGELPFSSDRALSDGLIDAYLNEFRRPLASTLVLDTSSSMKGPRREQLLQALHGLAGDDTSLSGRLSQWTYRERIGVLPFADTPGRLRAFEFPALSPPAAKPGAKKKADDAQTIEQVRQRFKAYIDSLPMEGGTALYDSVLVALQHTHAQRQRRPHDQYSIIALTDGNDTRSSLDAFEQAYALLPQAVHDIPVFMILFGDANEADLYRLVEVTGGKVFDARTTPLSQVFKDIRAHQ